MSKNFDYMKYAPVIIPTLNRYEHFKRCLESLEKCTGAEMTEVYVGLDFPPSDKYVEGWKKIDIYLKEKEVNNHFKKLIVVRRETNCGVGHQFSNGSLLVKQISDQFDRYVFTEDDNEFSPCFLEYMNKCLERFKDDERVNLVCGYNYVVDFPESYRNNFYITKNGCPWGTGHWVNKSELISSYYDFDKLADILRDPQQTLILQNRSSRMIRSIINILKSRELLGDSIKGILSVLFDTYCIMPRESMVRNWGNDGTGVHSKRNNEKQHTFYSEQPISKELHFEFTDDIFTYEPVYLERHNYSQKMTPYRWLRKIHSDVCFKIDYFLFKKFNYIPKSRWI